MMGGRGWTDRHGWMDRRDRAAMTREHGRDFTDHRTDALAANRDAEIAWCRHELRYGSDPQARDIARTLLRLRQAQLTWLHRHHDQHSDHGHD